MSNEYEEVGYDLEHESGGGPYLRLKKKDDRARVRFVSKPIRFKREFQGKVSDQFAVKVIYRNTETKENEVRGFQYGWMVYDAIAALYKDEDWGDPAGYDIEIVRTEVKGSYYTVTPKPKKALTDAEKELVAGSDIDLVKMYVDREQAQAQDDEYDPFKDE